MGEERKVRFKMYKSGRQWVTAGIAVMGLAVAMQSRPQTVSAVSQSTAQSTVLAAEDDSTDNSQNLDLTGSEDDITNNFKANGNAAIMSGGNGNATVVLTPDKQNQSGNLTLNSQIDLDYDFDMKATIDISSGDGISVGFHTGNTDQVGRKGGSLGFATLPGAFGWKADTYYNASAGSEDIDQATGNPFFGPDPKVKHGDKFGAFVDTDANGLTINTNTNQARAQRISVEDHYLHVHYDAKTHKLTVTLNAGGRYGQANTKTWTEDISDYIPADHLVSFFIAGSTGQAHSQQTFTLNSFSYHAVGTLHVNYIDVETGEVLVPKDIRGKLNSTVTVHETQDYLDTIKTLADQGYSPVDPNPTDDTQTITTDNQEPIVIKMQKAYQATVNLVDDDADGKPLDSKTITGKTGELNHLEDVETAKQALIDKGYDFVGDDIPDDFTFTPEDQGRTFTLHFKHHHDQVDKTVDRNISYEGAGTKTPAAVTQTATYTVDTDRVTGDVTYTPANFPAVTTPVLAGYSADYEQVPSVTLTNGGEPVDFKVHYTAKQNDAQITFVDDDNNQKQVGDSITVPGKTDEVVNYDVSGQIPDGYELVDKQAPVTGTVTIEPGSDDDVTIHLKHKHAPSTKDVDRTITYVGAKNNPEPIKQTGTYTVDTDLVTKKATYTPVTFAEVVTPTIDGYEANLTKVEGIELSDGSDPADVEVTYTAKDNEAKIIFVDDDNGKKQVGDAITKTGKTDQSVNYDVTTKIPAHYRLADNTQPVTGTIAIAADDGDTVTIHLKHMHEPAKKPVTRTITYVGAKENPEAVEQTATYDVDTDLVTNKVTYTPVKFAEVKTPTIDGYDVDRTKVDGLTLSDGSKPDDVTVTYTARANTAKVTFVDDDDARKPVGEVTTVAGITDQSVPYDVTAKIPANYRLSDNQQPVSGEITITPTDSDNVEIHLKHRTTKITPEQPNGHEKDVKRTITQTIHYLNEAGDQMAKANIQQVTFTRTAKVDDVTGTVTPISEWQTAQPSFADVFSPVIKGYAAGQTKVAGTKVKPETANRNLNVIYSTTEQPITIQYLDQTTGKTLNTAILKGKTGTAVDNPAATQIATYQEEGYELVKDGTAGAAQLTFTPGGTAYVVTLKHGTKTVTPDQPGTHADELVHRSTQTIHYVAGNTTMAPDSVQTVSYQRSATVDLITDKIIATTDWQAVDAEAYQDVFSPIIKGYRADQTKVTGTPVTATTEDTVITVQYSTTDQPITIQYVDQTTGKTLHTAVLQGKTGTTVANPAGSQIAGYQKQGYTLVQDGTKGAQSLTFTPGGTAFIVTLKHGTTTVTPDNPGTYANDVIRHITQTIHYVGADDMPVAKDNVQQVTYTRSITVDNVTGTVTPATDWQASGANHFADVFSPVIKGYHADQTKVVGTQVDATAVSYAITVHYAATEQPITIQYIQDGTGKTLKTDVLKGKTGTTITYDVEAVIDQYQNKGYFVASNSVPEVDRMGQIVVQPGGNTYQVHLVIGQVPEEDDSKIVRKKVQTPDPISVTGKQLHDQGYDNEGYPLKPTAAQTTQGKQDNGKRKLPQTGEATSNLSGVGMLVTAMTALLGIGSYRRRRED